MDETMQLLLIFGGLLCVGVIKLGFALRAFMWAIKNKNWPSVEADILKVERRRYRGAFQTGWLIAIYRVVVFYQYAVQGMTFTKKFSDYGPQLIFGMSDSESNGLEEHYKMKKKLRVYYHPKWPHISCIFTGLHRKDFFDVCIGLGAMFVGYLGIAGVIH